MIRGALLARGGRYLQLHVVGLYPRSPVSLYGAVSCFILKLVMWDRNGPVWAVSVRVGMDSSIRIETV